MQHNSQDLPPFRPTPVPVALLSCCYFNFSFDITLYNPLTLGHMKLTINFLGVLSLQKYYRLPPQCLLSQPALLPHIRTLYYSNSSFLVTFFNLPINDHILPPPTTVISTIYILISGQDSSVGTATRYGLDGPGIESCWGRDSPQPSRPDLGPTQPPIQWVPGIFPGGKAAEAWR